MPGSSGCIGIGEFQGGVCRLHLPHLPHVPGEKLKLREYNDWLDIASARHLSLYPYFLSHLAKSGENVVDDLGGAC